MKKISIICLVLLLCLTACAGKESKNEGPTFEDILESSDTLNSKVEKIATLPTLLGYAGMQGGWTDGKYYYQSRLKYDLDNQNNNEVIIVKYDIEKKEVVQQSEPLKLDHCNDITYNSKEGYFVICHNEPNYKKISFLDANTLTIVGTKNLSNSIWAIAYNEEKDQYVIGLSGTYKWKTLNADFEVIAEYEGTERVEGFTKQSVDCDENYVYFLYHSLPKIAVFDWDGNFVTLITINVGGETENISVIDGTIYVGTASGMYKVTELYGKE